MKSMVLISLALTVLCTFGSALGYQVCDSKEQEYYFRLSPIQARFDIEQAAKDCKALGGSLAHKSLLQGRYFEAIRGIVYHSGVSSVYLGLNDKATEGKWRWTDGLKVADDTDFRGAQLFEWASGQPDNHYNEDCAYVRTNDLLMNDFDCKNSWEGRALCEIEKKPGHKVYKFHLTPQQTLLDIDVARKTCAALNGRLASDVLDIPAYYQPIRDLLRADQLKTGNIYVYTGFNDRAREHDWVGEGGAPFSNAGLYKWQKSEPNNYWNQDCAMIVTTRSELWDVRCKGQYKAKALCEIEA